MMYSALEMNANIDQIRIVLYQTPAGKEWQQWPIDRYLAALSNGDSNLLAYEGPRGETKRLRLGRK